MAGEILAPLPEHTLVAADTEHFAVELVDYVHTETSFDLITPIPNRQSDRKRWRQIPAAVFKPHWAGYATAVLRYTPHHSRGGPYYELVQRQGERPRIGSSTASSPPPTAIRSTPSPAIIPIAGTSRSSSTSTSR